MRRLSSVRARRRGIVAVMVAVLLVVLIGFVALAVDGGSLQENKRHVQNAADAAALAAATQLFVNTPAIVASYYVITDPGNNATTSAFATAAGNGYANDKTTSIVTVNIPPKSGPFAGKPCYAEVLITYFQPRYFSSIWGNSKLAVPARAVALGRWGGSGHGVIVLDPTAQDALDASGTGALTVTGGADMVVDSNNGSAARTTGGGTLTANAFDIVGGTTGTFNGPVRTGQLPVPDPLAYLPAPANPVNGTMVTTNLGKGNKQYLLSPGRFSNLPNFNQGDVVILQQASANSNGGIYFIDGGGFNSTGADIIMDNTTSGGVMIYNNPGSAANSQGIQIQGNSSGTVNLSALTSGPYAGILFFQNRTATQTMSVSGNGSFGLTGTFYTANALLSVTGNGTATIGSQYISRTLNISGGGNITINYTENGTARERGVYLVE